METFLRQFGGFTETEITAIVSSARVREASAQVQLFQAGVPFLSLWFVESGMIRAYRIVNGEDYTFFFFPEGHFAVDYASFLTGHPSSLYMEALTEVRFRVLSKETVEHFYDSYPSFERLGRKMAEQAYLSATARLKDFQVEPLEVRYQNLLNQAPELFAQIPQYHIASYLGVKPPSLSRLRAKLSGRKR